MTSYSVDSDGYVLSSSDFWGLLLPSSNLSEGLSHKAPCFRFKVSMVQEPEDQVTRMARIFVKLRGNII